MRIVQIYREASPPFGYIAYVVNFYDDSSCTIHLPPLLGGGSEIKKWLERESGKRVRAWREAIPRR